MPTVCSTPAIQHLFLAGASRAAGQPWLESQDGLKGPIPSLPSEEGKWQEAGRGLLKDTQEVTGHWSHKKSTTPAAQGVLTFQQQVF